MYSYPLTETNRATNQARYVSRLPDAGDTVEATVLYVMPPDEFADADEVAFGDVDAAITAAESLEAEGIAVERVAVGGEVERTILDAATDREVDSIVMGGRKRSGITDVILGGITQDIMLAAERPVTLTG